MRNYYLLVVLLFCLGCGQTTNVFKVDVELKNAPSSITAYLDILEPGNANPKTVDTVFVAGSTVSTFTLQTAATEEEGVYRVRFENGPFFLLVGDQSSISIQADWKTPENFQTKHHRFYQQIYHFQDKLMKCRSIQQHHKFVLLDIMFHNYYIDN